MEVGLSCIGLVSPGVQEVEPTEVDVPSAVEKGHTTKPAQKEAGLF